MDIPTISLPRLALLLLPALGVVWVMYRWELKSSKPLYAFLRMLTQLMLIGYILAYIFQTENFLVVFGVLCVMVVASGWIALNTLSAPRLPLFGSAFLSIAVGGGLILLLVTQAVLSLETWYDPRFVIPLAGMIFANAMTSISLAAERLEAEMQRGVSYTDARSVALKTAMIPIINSFLAVGLVALPGMMTGQILSGVSPLIAARYQIMVMGMIFASGGIATVLFLLLVRKKFDRPRS